MAAVSFPRKPADPLVALAAAPVVALAAAPVAAPAAAPVAALAAAPVAALAAAPVAALAASAVSWGPEGVWRGEGGSCSHLAHRFFVLSRRGR
jgi:hypothetical protein